MIPMLRWLSPQAREVTMQRMLLIVGCVWWCAGSVGQAQYVQVELPLQRLPEQYAYQKTLRDFLASLTEKDFEVAHQPLTVVPTTDPEEQYRLWLLNQHMHNVSAARLPAASFTLPSVEGLRGFVLPCAPQECQMLAWLASWNYAGNPYRGSKPLMLRAFVLAAVEIIALDYLYEHDPRGANRSDYLGGNLIWLGFTYRAIKDSLPAEARAALEAGLKKLVVTLNEWGPRGAMTDMDLFAPVGLGYASQAMDDADVKRIAESYSRRLFTDPHFFHPAGYFADNGCFDTSYNGISLYFGAWAALQSDWKFARDAIDQAYRLRAHLSFPHPDGVFSGPSAMASRCSSDPPHDQWQFPPRTYGSAMVTSEAIYAAPLPSDSQRQAAPAAVVAQLNAQLEKPREASLQTWRESHWSGALNYAYESYPPGYYARRVKLIEEGSPLNKPLYLRNEEFVRDFGKAFVIARRKGFAAAIHTGPVSGIHKEWQRPYGFGGGQLCAFWTPATGPVILSRRRGLQGHVFDRFEEWRQWPVHAVTGVTATGDLVTSSRIERPAVESRTSENAAEVAVSGSIPKYLVQQKTSVPTDLVYERHFWLDSTGVRIRTTVESPAQEHLAELYETLPVFLRETAGQPLPAIRFQVGSSWLDATADPQSPVNAIEILRAGGAVRIAFLRPVTVRLSPDVWTDGFQTQAQCRTILIDLLATRTGKEDMSVEYTISAPPPAPGAPESPPAKNP
jgi:hypothetical protein